MEIVVSGARPTGLIHLGNYLGAIKNFVRMQESYQCYFFVADYHSLTTHPNARGLTSHVHNLLATYLACGLDPDKSVMYIQSDLPQIPELYLLFNMFAYKGELEKVPTFKEKVRMHRTDKNAKGISAGLLTYPTLMAVDIVIHRATKVPVGKDQAPHLEMTRNFANRFNHIVGQDFFPEPKAFSFSDELIKVPSLDGTGKMSKSAVNPNSAIYVTDEDKVIRKKIMKAKTDGGPIEMKQEKPEIIENIFDLMRLVSSPDTLNHFEDAYDNCSIRYGDMKKQLAEDMIQLITPIRERIKVIGNDTDYLKKVTTQGAEKARHSANATLQEAKALLGLKYF
jgi:tryptophanyl-tRNA synthetase